MKAKAAVAYCNNDEKANGLKYSIIGTVVPGLMILYGACHWCKVNQKNTFEGGENANIYKSFIEDEKRMEV